MEKRKMDLLKSLEKEFKDAGDIGEVSVFTAKELNAPMDVLRAEIAEFGSDLTSVLGEFFFLPFEETEVIYFSSVITITGNLPHEIVPEITSAIARLNYYMPCGCFAVGEDDRNLVFRFTVPMRGDEDQKDQETDISIAANTAIMTAEKFEGYLKLIIKNETTVDEMISLAKNGN